MISIPIPKSREGSFFVFFILSAISLWLFFLIDEVLLSDSIIAEHLYSQMSATRIEHLLQSRTKWKWVNYLLVPIVYLVKLILISNWLLCGAILFGYDQVSFKKIFRVTLLFEFFWLIPSFTTVAWFGFIHTDYTLAEIQYFKPLSLLIFFEVSAIEPWLIIPLQSISLFELGYMILLTFGLMQILGLDFTKALKFTVPVYGSALITWLVFVTFLSINLNT